MTLKYIDRARNITSLRCTLYFLGDSPVHGCFMCLNLLSSDPHIIMWGLEEGPLSPDGELYSSSRAIFVPLCVFNVLACYITIYVSIFFFKLDFTELSYPFLSFLSAKVSLIIIALSLSHKLNLAGGIF